MTSSVGRCRTNMGVKTGWGGRFWDEGEWGAVGDTSCRINRSWSMTSSVGSVSLTASINEHWLGTVMVGVKKLGVNQMMHILVLTGFELQSDLGSNLGR